MYGKAGYRYVRLVAALTITGLSACSQSTQDSSTEPKPTEALISLAKPNPAIMERAVADLLTAEWETLTQRLSNPENDAAARAQAYADYGLSAYGNGILVSAEQAFDNAITLTPSDSRWLYFRSVMHQAAGELDAAVQGFQRVLELRPDDNPTRLRLAQVLLEQSNTELAKTLFSNVLEQDENNAAALYGLGRVASTEDDHARAVSYFEAALKLQPYADRIYYPLALSLRRLGEVDKAKAKLVLRGTNEPYFADPLFDQISQGQERLSGLWTNMNAGSQAFVDGEYTTAVTEFQKATKNHPEDPRAWQSLGMGLNKIGDASGAIDAYRRALALDNENAVINHTLAKLLIAGGQLAEAEPYLNQALEVDARFFDAQVSLAELYARTNRAEKALQQYVKAEQLDPQSSDVALGRVNVLAGLGRTPEAAKTLQLAVAANPKNVELRSTYGLILAELGDLETAKQELDTAIKTASEGEARGRAHYAMGTLKLRENDGLGAIDEFGQALKLNPNHNAAGLELARTFLRIRDLEQSLAAYEVHIGLWPAMDINRIEAARVSLMLGDGKRAVALLQAGTSSGANTPRLLGSLARLLVLTTDPGLRDIRTAMDFAKQALNKSNSLTHLETLALVHSAAKEFSAAIDTQRQLISNASANLHPHIRERLETNLKRYQSGELGRLPLDAL